MQFFPKRGFTKHVLEEKQQLGLGQWVLNPSLGSHGVPSYKMAKVASTQQQVPLPGPYRLESQ